MIVVQFMVVILVGCSEEVSSVSGEQSQSTEIEIVDFAMRNVFFDKLPERIVALGNGEVDIITALGGTIVGRPSSSTAHLHEDLQDVPVIGSVHTVDLEKITVLQPDVVLGHHPINAGDVPMLESIGAKVVLTHANSIDDIFKQVKLFGKLLVQEEKAEQMVNEMMADLEQISVDPETQPNVLMIYGAPGTYMAALPNSLAGDILEQAGGVNVASAFPKLQNFPQYAQLNTERVIEANPEYILIMTHGDTEAVKQGLVDEMEANPAWNSIQAVKENHIHVLPAEWFGTNPGTDVVDAVRWLAELLES